jgi:hypothetical protein
VITGPGWPRRGIRVAGCPDRVPGWDDVLAACGQALGAAGRGRAHLRHRRRRDGGDGGGLELLRTRCGGPVDVVSPQGRLEPRARGLRREPRLLEPGRLARAERVPSAARSSAARTAASSHRAPLAPHHRVRPGVDRPGLGGGDRRAPRSRPPCALRGERDARLYDVRRRRGPASTSASSSS